MGFLWSLKDAVLIQYHYFTKTHRMFFRKNEKKQKKNTFCVPWKKETSKGLDQHEKMNQ